MEEPSRTVDEGPPLRPEHSPGEAAAGNEATESWASLPNHLVEAIEAAEARILEGRTQEGAAS